MANTAKLLAKMRNNPCGDWSIEDMKVIARHFEMDYDHDGTSHCIFRHEKAGRLSVPAHKPIRAAYVKLFLELLDKVISGGTNE